MSELNEVERSGEAANKRNRILIAGLAVAIIAIIVLIWQVSSINTQRENTEAELNSAYLQLDSISNELDDRILTISQLGGEIDTLLKIKEELETEKKALLDREQRRQRTIRGLQDKVDGYQELLLAKDAEIEQLRSINEQLLSENSNLKTEKQELNKSIQNINQEKEQLAEKVALAGRLKTEDMRIFAVNDRDREREFEFRNRHIDQLKITFAIPANKVAPIEGKEILIRIIAPDGQEIFDVAKGSGSFMFNNREMFYTAKKELLYDRTRQQVEVFYDKGSEYPVGEHTVEVYTDDYMMGKGSFIVK
jgi:cell division protein ZapB